MAFEKLYTVDDVAEFTNLTSRTIRNYLKDGILKGHKIGGQWRFTMENINELLASSTSKNANQAQSNQFLSDFISGVNIDITGELQICTVADYYCKRIEDAALLNAELTKIQEFIAEPEAKYFYYYDAREQKARYTFFGTPDIISSYLEQLNILHKKLLHSKKVFNGRSANYLAGRPDYPSAFFDYLYDEIGITANDVIADIGSGIGMMSKHFLKRGNMVYCIEPNGEMKSLADQLLAGYKGYMPLLATAENTSLKTDSVDYIVCGNSYGSFDKAHASIEFNRILKKDGKVIITHYYPDAEHSDTSLWDEFKSVAMLEADKLLGKEFIEGTAIAKTFYHIYFQDFYHFLSGCLSSAIAPKPDDERYEYFVNQIKKFFDERSVNDAIECKFKLLCLVGDINNLINFKEDVLCRN